MRKHDFEIVPLTRDMMLSFYGAVMTCRAYAAIRGDRILGIGGVRFENYKAILFSDLIDSERKNVRLIVAGARKAQELLRECHLPVYAEAAEINGAETTLRHLGFAELKDRIWLSPG